MKSALINGIESILSALSGEADLKRSEFYEFGLAFLRGCSDGDGSVRRARQSNSMKMRMSLTLAEGNRRYALLLKGALRALLGSGSMYHPKNRNYHLVTASLSPERAVCLLTHDFFSYRPTMRARLAAKALDSKYITRITAPNSLFGVSRFSLMDVTEAPDIDPDFIGRAVTRGDLLPVGVELSRNRDAKWYRTYELSSRMQAVAKRIMQSSRGQAGTLGTRAPYKDFATLNAAVTRCNKCGRLRKYAKLVARRKKPQFADWEYWAKPVHGFGDLDARLLIVGLAPAAHGGLRTGRVFTGDNSGRFLVRALYSAGFANQPVSESRNDGLVYNGCYVTAAVKCAPPDDKPDRSEFLNCGRYLDAELTLLKNARAILALGGLAFKAILDAEKRKGADVRGMRFAHGASYALPGGRRLYASYHPSPRNTNTGKLSIGMLVGLLEKIKAGTRIDSGHDQNRQDGLRQA